MIRLSVEYRQDSKITIQLWKSLVEDTPSTHINTVNTKHYNDMTFTKESGVIHVFR